MKPTLKFIRKDIQRIPTSSRAQHIKIKKILGLLVDLIEERVGKDPKLTDVANEIGKEESCGAEKTPVSGKTVSKES